MNENNRIAIFGGGSWATALVKLIQSNITDESKKMLWYMRDQESINFINEHNRNPRYLGSVNIDLSRVKPIGDIKKTIESFTVAFM